PEKVRHLREPLPEDRGRPPHRSAPGPAEKPIPKLSGVRLRHGGAAGMTRIPVNHTLLTWARERAGLDAPAGRFPRLSAWEAGERQPTVRQLEDFARAVHVVVTHEVPANSSRRINIP